MHKVMNSDVKDNKSNFTKNEIRKLKFARH